MLIPFCLHAVADIVKPPLLPQAKVNKCLIALTNAKHVVKANKNVRLVARGTGLVANMVADIAVRTRRASSICWTRTDILNCRRERAPTGMRNQHRHRHHQTMRARRNGCTPDQTDLVRGHGQRWDP